MVQRFYSPHRAVPESSGSLALSATSARCSPGFSHGGFHDQTTCSTPHPAQELAQAGSFRPAAGHRLDRRHPACGPRADRLQPPIPLPHRMVATGDPLAESGCSSRRPRSRRGRPDWMSKDRKPSSRCAVLDFRISDSVVYFTEIQYHRSSSATVPDNHRRRR